MDPFNEISSRLSSMADLQRRQREDALEMNGRKDAEIIFQYLMSRVKIFQTGLKENEELGLRLANFGIAAEIHIRKISFKNPNLIEFLGVDSADNEVFLVQHISQLNFMLSALKPISDKPYRIGFR